MAVPSSRGGRGNLGKFDLTPVTNALDYADGGVDNVAGVLDSIHGTAATAAGRVAVMAQQNLDLAQQICDLAADGSLDPVKAESLRDSLVSTSCDGSAKPPTTTMAGLIAEQAGAWGAVQAASDTGSGATAAALVELRSRIDGVNDALSEVAQQAHNEGSNVGSKIQKLNEKVALLLDARKKVKERVDTVATQQAAAIAGVKEAFRKAARRRLGQRQRHRRPADPPGQQERHREPRDARQDVRPVRLGPHSAAGKIARDGATTLEKQKKGFAQEQAAAGHRISDQVEQGLSGIATGGDVLDPGHGGRRGPADPGPQPGAARPR